MQDLEDVGVGWRQPHYDALMAQRPALGFLEVHSENFFAPGGAARATLRAAREHYSISLHGVGLSLGSACGLDGVHLDQLAALVAEVDPVRVSDHASFARVCPPGGSQFWHANDLLPVAFTEAGLNVMVRNVVQVQERLRRPLLVENLSAYLHWADADLSEPQFLAELARRSGCQLLLDVNNLMVNALNAPPRSGRTTDPVHAVCRWLDALDTEAIGEIHLAGYTDQAPGALIIDDHACRVRAPVWQVYQHALKRWGPRPTLMEWDTDLPDLSVLLAEAALAQQVMDTCRSLWPEVMA